MKKTENSFKLKICNRVRTSQTVLISMITAGWQINLDYSCEKHNEQVQENFEYGEMLGR